MDPLHTDGAQSVNDSPEPHVLAHTNEDLSDHVHLLMAPSLLYTIEAGEVSGLQSFVVSGGDLECQTCRANVKPAGAASAIRLFKEAKGRTFESLDVQYYHNNLQEVSTAIMLSVKAPGAETSCTAREDNRQYSDTHRVAFLGFDQMHSHVQMPTTNVRACTLDDLAHLGISIIESVNAPTTEIRPTRSVCWEESRSSLMGDGSSSLPQPRGKHGCVLVQWSDWPDTDPSNTPMHRGHQFVTQHKTVTQDVFDEMLALNESLVP